VGKLCVVGEEAVENELVVEKINNTASLSNGMHRELWSSNINNLNTSLGCNHGSNGRATETILFDHKILDWYWGLGVSSNNSQNSSTNRIGHVSLIGIDLDHDTLVDLGLVLSLMLFRIIWMDSVGHIGRNDETISDYSEIVLFCHIRLEIP